MSEDVNNDYGMMINIAAKYNKDAESINDYFTGFNQTSQDLLSSIGELLNGTDQIAQGASDGAESITDIAAKITEITDTSNSIMNDLGN
jgi:methyl-accepting chemotaxis protein